MGSHVREMLTIPRRINLKTTILGIQLNRYRWGVVALLLASVTDLLTTYVGIEYIGFVERNPAPAAILAQNGWMGIISHTLVSLGVIIGLTALLRYVQINHSSKVATVWMGVAAGVKVLATVWNTWLILTV